MSSRKRQIAGVLSLGATVTGAVGSATTSAGLFDWFSSKKDLEKKRKEKQEKGYDAAIEVAKNCIKIIKDGGKVEEILEKLISNKEELLLKKLGINMDGSGENIDKNDILYGGAESLENYFIGKFTILSKTSVNTSFTNNVKANECKKITFTNANNNSTSITVNGDTIERIKCLKNNCDNFKKNKKIENQTDFVETLIKIAREDTLGQFKEENPRKPVLNLSYEDIIRNLVEITMKDGQLTYRDDFYKIFKVKDDDKENSKATNVSKVLHELGYEENMSLLPGYSKEKGGLSIGRIARSFGPSTVVWTLGYLYPPVTVVGGIAGLLCNAVVKQSASSLWDNLRHKETRTSFLNPNNWEVNKFISGVVSSFIFYGISKRVGF